MMNISDRDRRILLWGLPIIALLIVAMMAKNLLSAQRQASVELQRASEDTVWMQAQMAFSDNRESNCSDSLPSMDSLRNLAQQRGVDLTVYESETGNALQLHIARAPGNQALSLLRQLSCSGWRIQHVDFTSQSEGEVISGSARLQR